jgi:polysaccharide biosynthesis transport protein
MNPQLPFSAHAENELVDFPELWRTVSRYKVAVLAITILAAAAGTLAVFSERPLYLATATVLIETRAPKLAQATDVYDPGYGSMEYLATQANLIRSEELVGRVVDRLRLVENPLLLAPRPSLLSRLLPSDWRYLLPFLPEVPEPEPSDPAPDRLREAVIAAVLQDVTVSPVFRTQLVKIQYQSASPRFAADVTNALADLFVESGLEARFEAAERTTRWLTDRMADLRAKLQNAERALQAYREKHQLVNVGGARNLYEEEVLDNSRKLREAQKKKTELASSYWKIQQAGDNAKALQEISALLLDPLVQRAADNLSQAQFATGQLQERYGAKHPQMAAAQSRLEQAQAAYDQQLRLAANGVKAEYEIAAETERALMAVVETGKQQIRALDQRDYELSALEREVQSSRELYDTFLKRFKETDTTRTFEVATARVVDHATVPRFPFKPEKLKVIALWTVGGLVLGILLATLRHLLSETIRSPEHLEAQTQMSVLSVLPPVAGLGRRTSAPDLVLKFARAPFPEGIRSIRASLLLNDVDKRMKRVMFTSALPKEGKSSVASSFATVLGQSEKVILIESDLRAPSLKAIFGIGKEAPGLVEILTGQAKIEQALFRHSSGVDVLPVAKIPANPAEIIASAAFSKLIELLASRYERLVFDTPPCQVASDSILLSHRMDAVIFVIHGTVTGMRTIQSAVKQLRNAQAPILGLVLNQVDPRKAYGREGAYYAYGQYGS